MMGSFSLAIGVGGMLGGTALDRIGFEATWSIGAYLIMPAPLLVFVGFHPKVMGRELAPQASKLGLHVSKLYTKERKRATACRVSAATLR